MLASSEPEKETPAPARVMRLKAPGLHARRGGGGMLARTPQTVDDDAHSRTCRNRVNCAPTARTLRAEGIQAAPTSLGIGLGGGGGRDHTRRGASKGLDIRLV